MKEQEIYVKVPVGEEFNPSQYVRDEELKAILPVKKLTALVFTVEEFEAEKLKIASEAWDAGADHGAEVERKGWFEKITAPSKEAYLSNLK